MRRSLPFHVQIRPENAYISRMLSGSHAADDAARKAGWFVTTHWSVVLAAGQGAEPGAAKALEELCQAYWHPLYAFLRRQGHSVEDAQDLVQAFLCHLLERGILQVADPRRGRFRSFLLGALKHFVSDETRKLEAQKRGGGQPNISLNWADAEGRFQQQPSDEASPDRLFERHWATTLLDRALDRLRAECAAAERREQFEQLQGFVTGEKGAVSYAEAAARLGMSLSAVKSAILRLRRRYHETVREEVSHTVSSVGEVEDELRYLLHVFSRGP
jgi:RNA polymerase sigma factor (sigma-70 family)